MTFPLTFSHNIGTHKYSFKVFKLSICYYKSVHKLPTLLLTRLQSMAVFNEISGAEKAQILGAGALNSCQGQPDHE